MKTATINELAYILKQAKENNQPAPIFFLGAGASRSGGVPLAGEIETDILSKYPDNPKIKNLEKTSYPNLMECLLPHERNQLLKDYINKARINVTHIYLAQLMTQGYVDYVLTVNFDNLMLKALALFNEIPPSYDMAVLKDLTTTTFHERSVVYLHGQHHGLWLLNTDEEMAKVKEIIPPILHSIKNGRPWIFIGYSGQDPIFDHIKNLGRFDNGLYWVTHMDSEPHPDVCRTLLDKENTNSFLIKGFDADSFMIKLNSELELAQPIIIDKPFYSLQSLLSNIVDIDDKQHFAGVKERLEIAKRQVQTAIEQFDRQSIEPAGKIKQKTVTDAIKKEIIDLIIKETYDDNIIEAIIAKTKDTKNREIDNLLADYYYNWGTDLGNLAKTKSGEQAEKLYNLAFEKYENALKIKPDKHEAFNNWGTYLGNLAKTKSGEQAEKLYNLAFEKFENALKIKPDTHDAFNNWGTYLGELAKTKSGEQAEKLYNLAFEKYENALKIKPDTHDAFNNWGTYLGELAQTKSGEQAEKLYNLAFEKYENALKIKPDTHEAFYNWGNYLGELAQTKSGEQAEKLYNLAFEKFENALKIKPDKHEAFNNWGTDLGNLAKTKSGEQAEKLYNLAFEKFENALKIKPDQHEAFYNWGTYLGNLAKTKSGEQAEKLYNLAFEKLKSGVDLGGGCYNLSCYYALQQNKEAAFEYLTRSLKNQEIESDFVLEDDDWSHYREDEDFRQTIAQFKK